MKNEIERIFIEEGRFTEADYPFTIKPIFSTLGSIMGISRQKPLISFLPNFSMRDLLGFNGSTIYEENNKSPSPVDILSSDNVFLNCDIAKGMNCRGKRSRKRQNFTMDVDPGYKYNERFRGGVQWYMIENKDFTSSISFKFKNENNQIVSFNGQSITFRLSIKKIHFIPKKFPRL